MKGELGPEAVRQLGKVAGDFKAIRNLIPNIEKRKKVDDDAVR